MEVTAFAEVPRDALLRSLENVDDATLESLGVPRGDAEAKTQAEDLLRHLRETLKKAGKSVKAPTHSSPGIDRPRSLRQARPPPTKMKGPLHDSQL